LVSTPEAFARAEIAVSFALSGWYVPERSGISAATKARNVGVAAPQLPGPAKTVFAVWVARVTAKVPEVVTGEPATLRKDGTVKATLVTVPVDAAAQE
jgi:hypothetical protein